MTEKQALENGYSFTGSYSRNKDEMTIKLKEYKSRGYKGTVVTVKDSPYSRGTIGQGYSIYLEKRYFVDKERKAVEAELSTGIAAQERRAYEKYQKEMKEINDRREYLESRLQKLSQENV